MAVGAPSESPAIVVRELDRSGVVPNVQTTTGAFVGNFNWGPVQQATQIPNETSLVERFGSPDSSNTIEFHGAAYFLRYASTLQVVREVTSAAFNSYDSDANATVLVKNRDNWDDQIAARDSDKHTFIAKYPGNLGNSIKVSVLPADSGDASTIFDAWTYASSFDAAPTTSTHAADRTATSDEAHVAVIDEDGLFGGTKGAVLETFPFVSLALGALNADGSTNYIKDVVNNSSEYVWMAGFGDALKFSDTAGTTADSGDSYLQTNGAPTNVDISLKNGINSGVLTPTEYATGFDKYEDVDTIQVDFLIAPGMTTRTDQTTVVNDLVTIAQTTRKDCVVTASPARADVVASTTPVTNAVATANTFTNSSYLIVDNNYLKVYDKYTDQYIQIPASSSTAGIMAASDFNTAPWFSPAGPRRGQYVGITSLSYSPNKAERDTLYKAGLNPIANIPGQGVLLFGDKTKLARPSAFDRINVRRLFLGIERAISIAARNVMFEFNDEFTRAEFKNVVEPFLREIQGRRGITDFRVVCDDTNNTAAVIDRNEFKANIFIKPARSINYVTLTFVAVRTGVDFAEVVGTV
jgi:hypothetical protein|tara:strand:- start:1162 stop:2901 length:1740 start_codon:yes stop_codon:yes gene_type:complete